MKQRDARGVAAQLHCGKEALFEFYALLANALVAFSEADAECKMERVPNGFVIRSKVLWTSKCKPIPEKSVGCGLSQIEARERFK